MNSNIVVEKLKAVPVKQQKVEIVERKGLAHPDNIADSLAEEFSIALCKEYIKKFGVILHHNVDKLDIVGGQTSPKFKGGSLKKPIIAFYSGRATSELKNTKFDLKKIAVNSAKKWIKENIRFLNPEKHLKYIVETKAGAGNLTDLYKRKETKYMPANDTSLGSGYYPMTDLEKLTYDVERTINSRKFKLKHPYSGEDVKVMCLRRGDKVEITVAQAFIDRYIKSIEEYKTAKENILTDLKESFGKNIFLNTADDLKRGIDGCYLTVTGTSAEMGDDGAVGRGNRINGVIPFNRILSMEAAAGKNPVNHVGKIYNIMAFRIAEKIYESLKADEVYVRLLSQIGTPINKPAVADVWINSKNKFDKNKIKGVVYENLQEINKVADLVINRKVKVF